MFYLSVALFHAVDVRAVFLMCFDTLNAYTLSTSVTVWSSVRVLSDGNGSKHLTCTELPIDTQQKQQRNRE